MAGILIVGCGDIGKRLAGRYLSRGISVTGVVRSAASAEALEELGVKALRLDLDAPDPALPAVGDLEVFYLVPPPPGNETDARSRAVIAGLDGRPRKLVLLSTTGVYGDCDGNWVDESTPVAPATDRARRRVDAEERWGRWSQATGVPLVTLRVPGIYSRSRIPVSRLESGNPVVDPEETGWTNRIHADDLAMVLETAMRRAAAGAVYNVSDGRPGKISDYLLAAAAALGIPPPPVVSRAEAEDGLSDSMRSYLDESRRIDNRRMLKELEITLAYPSLEQGLQAG